jgi:hypothetical protein
MKKKILIALNSQLYIRNYIESEAFLKIIKNFDCYFLINKKYIVLNPKINKKKVIFFKIYPLLEKLYKFKTKIEFLRNPYKSRTIDFLIKKFLAKKLIYKDDDLKSTFIIFFRLLNFILNFFIYFLKDLFHFIFYSLDYFSKYNFYNIIINQIKPDLIIFPYQNDDIVFSSLLLTAKKKIPILGLVDNWDNLSSKSNFKIMPYFITVWGDQSKLHAIKYQGFKKNQIFVLGTPRYEVFFQVRNNRIESNFNFKYILFLESFFNFNNVVELKILDKIIRSNNIFKNYKIIYRPHPWQKKHDINISKLNLKSVVLDPQIKENYINRNFSTSFQPSLKYYPALIKNAELVITGPTSMLIEASIFKKKILLLGYKNFSEITYYDQLKHFVHLEGVDKLSNVTICRNLNRLEINLLELFKQKTASQYTGIDLQRNYFLYNSEKSYSHRLNDVVKFILNKKL